MIENLIPDVHTKRGMVEFNQNKIYESLVRETSLNNEQAKEICMLTVRRIISNRIDFLSGPHIREIVCSILAENGFEESRKKYGRVGIPFYDYRLIMESNLSEEEKDKEILRKSKSEYYALKEVIEGVE